MGKGNFESERYKRPPLPLAQFSNCGQPFGVNCSAIPSLRKGRHQKLHRLIGCTRSRISDWNQLLEFV